MDLTEHFRFQARACADMGSPMYAELLHRCADDVSSGGVVGDVLIGFEGLSGTTSALALRLLGSVHRLVLERRADELAMYYPSVGGAWELDGGWAAFARLLRGRPEDVREWLDRPPQTNEVGRSAALYGGLLHLPALGAGELPVRLVEIGASAGLNLRADRFGYLDGAGRRFGSDDPGLVLADAWRGRSLEPWPGLAVAERLGSDVAPVDASTTEGRLVLTAYVWPDQRVRLERLRAALRVAAGLAVEIRRQDAVSFLQELRLREGTTTVLWHSVMWQYLTPEDRIRAATRIEALGDEATPSHRFVHLRAEPVLDLPDDVRFLVRLRSWPGGAERVIGETVGHGVPTTWL